ncbi:MAG: GNAT family N-acetyltransferase [Hyphomicrobiales bacterium]
MERFTELMIPALPISSFAWQKLRAGSRAASGILSNRSLSSNVPSAIKIGGRIGNLEVRLARTPRELRKAQSLRYKVFYHETAARADTKTRLFRRDKDRFDQICDHLLVLDHDVLTARKNPKIVGTYRLLRQEIAAKHNGFYTAEEFAIESLLTRHSQQIFLELGRSCVLPAYRGSRTVELLWHGIWSYVLAHKIDVMFGCASFSGTEPNENALALSFLHHHAIAEEEWAVKALPSRSIRMDILPKADVSARDALRNLPPLVKGYLRLGAKIGNGAVIDHQFGTTDILIILPISKIDQRYIKHYGAEADRFAA